MATAFVPDSIHSVIPKILPSGVAAHSGRSAISSASGRLMLDRLFDLSSSGDSSTLPMSEEEFYRMKIKLKDRSVNYMFPHLLIVSSFSIPVKSCSPIVEVCVIMVLPSFYFFLFCYLIFYCSFCFAIFIHNICNAFRILECLYSHLVKKEGDAEVEVVHHPNQIVIEAVRIVEADEEIEVAHMIAKSHVIGIDHMTDIDRKISIVVRRREVNHEAKVASTESTNVMSEPHRDQKTT